MNIFTNFTRNHCIVANLKYKSNTASYLLISTKEKLHNIFGKQTAHVALIHWYNSEEDITQYYIKADPVK